MGHDQLSPDNYSVMMMQCGQVDDEDRMRRDEEDNGHGDDEVGMMCRDDEPVVRCQEGGSHNF